MKYQAVAVAQKALSSTSCESEFYSMKKFEGLGHLFICRSCPSLIAMNFRSVVRVHVFPPYDDFQSLVCRLDIARDMRKCKSNL